ncbi:MAG: serine/threonine-protein kinase [Polyangiaceae bacterium]|nr:serine/threonine-protein kinase [Polyangiaceae bacterium]
MSLAPQSLPQVDKYELVEELGHGGMATVYRARDKRLGREVALKIIHRHLRESAEVSARFVSEARAVAMLRHPNIVEVYDVSDEGESERYLVVELVEGTTLRKLLQERGHLPPEVGAAIGIQIAGALAHAHEKGVIHRDVKPENILVPRDLKSHDTGTEKPQVIVKMTDFGIAKLLDAQGVTSTGQVLGSPAHMAPEQIEGSSVDERADVFGLGVMLYECMTGRLPFEGSNPAQVLRRVLEGSFAAADRVRPTVGGQWARIIGRALAHEPEGRFRYARDLQKALGDELLRVGINGEELLAEYLADPDAVTAKYADRVVPRLVSNARQARKARQGRAAADDFNRALAYQPQDKALLAEVAKLARFQGLKLWGVRAFFSLLALTVVGIGIYRWVKQSDLSAVEKPGAVAQVRELASRATHQGGKVPEGAAPATSDVNIQVASPRGSGRSGVSERARPKLASTRAVKIVVSGPQNPTVKVDGQEVEWFGRQFQLTTGPHTFEFVPPNEICCVGAVKITRNIEPSVDPNSELIVSGKIELRPATLTLQAPLGVQASCGQLGELVAQESRQLTMDKPVVEGHCTVFPPQGSALAPKRIDVTLRAGERLAIPWP